MNDFEKLYKEYYPRVYSFLYKICRNHDLCEEMTQETFFQAYLSFHKFRGNSSIFTYLAAIAKNVYFKYLRKSKVETVDIDLLVTSDDDSSAQPYEVLEKKLAAEKVNRFIKELPKNYKDICRPALLGNRRKPRHIRKFGKSNILQSQKNFKGGYQK